MSQLAVYPKAVQQGSEKLCCLHPTFSKTQLDKKLINLLQVILTLLGA